MSTTKTKPKITLKKSPPTPVKEKPATPKPKPKSPKPKSPKPKITLKKEIKDEPLLQVPAPVAKVYDIPSAKLLNNKIEFDEEGIPLASVDNFNKMSLEDVEKYCERGWNLQKHVNPLLIKLDLSVKGTKPNKCARLVKYKREHPFKTPFKNQSQKYPSKSTLSYESFNWRQDPIEVSYRGRQWTLPNSPKFRDFISNKFATKYRLASTGINLIEPKDPRSMFKYQGFVQDYLDPSTPYRSSLIFHGLGSGKTRTAIELSNCFIKDKKKILVLLPGALRNNFMEELYNWGIDGIRIPNYFRLTDEKEKKAKEQASNKVIAFYYDILTYNEAGLLDKLKRLVDSKTGRIEDRLIICDEEHHFISRMTKEYNISRKIYYFLMEKVHNCKFLFLSGTPLLNNAYELALLFNVLRGKFESGHTLFPEEEEAFNDHFVNLTDRSVQNREQFKRRIAGLVSYYAGNYEVSENNGNPSKEVHPVTKVPMSDHQFQLYLYERFGETKKEPKNKQGQQQAQSLINAKVGSSFRTYSRMVCNFSFPDGMVRPKPIGARDFYEFDKFKNEKIDPKKLIDVLDEVYTPEELAREMDGIPEKKTTAMANLEKKALTTQQRKDTYARMLSMAVDQLQAKGKKVFSDQNLSKYSPKMLSILNNIRSAPGSQGLIYIYTEFRILEGVRIMGMVLEHNGFEKINLTEIQNFSQLKKAKAKPRYGVISGDEDPVQRKRLLQMFKHPDNAHGEYIKVVMGTAASSEGLDFKRVTQVHIMEPYWNLVRNEQVVGRAVRFRSHQGLPKDEQRVHVYSYQMALTAEQQKDITNQLDSMKEAISTDEYVHQIAVEKGIINQQFIKLLKEAAVDCGQNYLQNSQSDPDLECLRVPPEIGKHSYYPDIQKDQEDKQYLKRLKQESFVIGKKKIRGIEYAFKVNTSSGQPIFEPPSLSHKNKIYHNIITLYDPDLLDQGIEMRRKYLVLGTDLILDV